MNEITKYKRYVVANNDSNRVIFHTNNINGLYAFCHALTMADKDCKKLVHYPVSICHFATVPENYTVSVNE